MIVYRDMMFCKFYKSCKHGDTCNRALTPEIEYNAFVADLPMCFFGSNPNCYEEIE